MANTIKLENPPLDTGVAVSLIESAIKSSVKANQSCTAVVKDWSAEKIGVGRGKLSHIVRVKLEWSENEGKLLPEWVILKLPTSESMEKMRAHIKAQMGEEGKADSKEVDATKAINLVQTSECAFYNFASGCNWNVLHPKCHLANVENPAVLILEDLSAGKNGDLFEGVNLNKCFSITEMLAALHAYCIKNSEWKSISDLHVPGKTLMDTVCGALLKTGKMGAESAKKNWPDRFDPIVDRISEIGTTMADLAFMDTINEDLGLPPVIVHGDFHVQNMMFDSGNHDKLMSVYDWQVVHTGCVAEDLSRLFTLSANAELRREHTGTVLRHYYESLAKELQPTAVPFSFETFQQCFDRVSRFSVARCLGGMLLFAGVDEMLGDNVEENRECILGRAKGMLEDVLALIDAGRA